MKGTDKSREVGASAPSGAEIATATEVVERWRRCAASDEACEDRLSELLEHLGILLLQAGRADDALPHLEEAVQCRRRLAASGQPFARLALADSLDRLRSCKEAAGAAGEAILAAARDAFAIRYRLAVADPASYVPGLRRAALDLAARLQQLDRDASAIAALSAEATWWLASADLGASGMDALVDGNEQPAVDKQMELAEVLVRLGCNFFAADRKDKAVAVLGEAVRIYQRLSEQEPGLDRPDYAQALSFYSASLDAVGRHGDALSAVEEAVAVYRALAQRDPEAYQVKLAEALDQQGVALGHVGRFEDGVASTREALSLVQASTSPNDRLLAVVLTNLAVHLQRLEEVPGAVDAIREALAAQRSRLRAGAQEHDAAIGDALQRLAENLVRLGDRREALPLLHETVAINRRLAAADADTYEPALARALKLLALGSYDLLSDEILLIPHAMTAALEAARIYVRLATLDPAEYTADYARMIDLVGVCKGELGQYQDALRYMFTAVQLYEGLVAEDPEKHGARAAEALRYLAFLLGATGQNEAALRASVNHLRIVRRLASHPPDGPRRVVDALDLLATRLAEAGRPSDALESFREAVAACAELPHSLMRQSYSVYLWDQIAARLIDIGDYEQAQQAGRTAEEIRRQSMDAFPPDPAHIDTVRILAARLARQGAVGRALRRFEQVVEWRRRQVLLAPEQHEADLAGSLNDFASHCSLIGRRVDAIHAWQQAIQLAERLSVHDRTLRDGLGGMYHNLGVDLHRLGRRSEALEASRAAIRIRRELGTDERNLANLARSLSNLGMRLSEEGLHEQALDASAESVALRRRCAGRDPSMLPALAISLSVFAHSRLSAGVELDQALKAAAEAVGLFEALTDSDAARHEGDLREARAMLTSLRSRIGG